MSQPIARLANAPPLNVLELDALFHALLQGFQRTQEVAERCGATFCIGGRRVLIQSAGAATLSALTPALEHLRAPEAARPDISIRTYAGHRRFDSRLMPPPGIYVATERGLQITVSAAPAAITAYDWRSRDGVAWLAGDPHDHTRAYATPLRELFAAALHADGLVGLHAAAVGIDEGGALLAGAGGAGKSTTAIACALAGMTLAGDDFCFAQSDQLPIAHSLYSSTKLTRQSAAWLQPPSAAATGRYVDDKQIYMLQRAPDVRLAGRMEIRAVLVLHITHQERSRLRPLAPIEALNVLAPTSVRLMGLPAHAAPALFRHTAAIVRRVPCYRLELGTDPAVAPELIRAAITGEARRWMN